MRAPDEETYFQVRRAGVEVARVELDEKVYTDYYGRAPHLGETALEVQLIDVHKDHRRAEC